VPGSRPRITEADRERLITLLREHYAQGQLDLDELERRVGTVLSAQYLDEAAPAVACVVPSAGRSATAGAAGTLTGQGEPYSPGPVTCRSPRNDRAASYAVSISLPVWRNSSGDTVCGSGPCR